jgi:hypothetical protein
MECVRSGKWGTPSDLIRVWPKAISPVDPTTCHQISILVFGYKITTAKIYDGNVHRHWCIHMIRAIRGETDFQLWMARAYALTAMVVT